MNEEACGLAMLYCYEQAAKPTLPLRYFIYYAALAIAWGVAWRSLDL
jgi:hypothetical protein